MAEKVTDMVFKVDLQCPRCYKKVKKILCKFPQIRDQVYDKKANTVKITVVCCSPEEIRDKLYCKGGKVIKCIEIVPPKKPEKTEPEKEKPKKQEVVKECVRACCCRPCCEGYFGGACACACACNHGYAVPWWHGYGCGHSGPCHVGRSDYVFYCEENTQPAACSIM